MKPDLTKLQPAHLTLAVLVLLAAGVAGRLLPHPPNVNPMLALALFAGFLLPRAWLAVAVAFGAMLAADLFLGLYEPPLMLANYAALLIPLLFRGYLRERLGALRVGGATVAASLGFYLASNLAVWALTAWYPPTLDGLLACYAAGLPFLHTAVLGNLFWAGVLFGAWGLIARHPGVRGHALS